MIGMYRTVCTWDEQYWLELDVALSVLVLVQCDTAALSTKRLIWLGK